MNTSRWLRAASIIALLFAIGHTLGRPWTPATALDAGAVVDAMKAIRFEAMGANRTYWDFYVGFGVSVSVYLAAQAATLWLLGGVARREPRLARPFIVLLIASFAAIGWITWTNFFPLPLVLCLAVVVCLVMSLIASHRTPDASDRET
jgi:hypothetical protein